jgi:hypothetical protein
MVAAMAARGFPVVYDSCACACHEFRMAETLRRVL